MMPLATAEQQQQGVPNHLLNFFQEISTIGLSINMMSHKNGHNSRSNPFPSSVDDSRLVV